MTFDDWYSQREWWRNDRDEWKEIWNDLSNLGVPDQKIADHLDSVMSFINREYGD